MRSIAIVGPDGSGKSTQARLLCDWLIGKGIPCTHEHQYGGRQAASDKRTTVRVARTKILGVLPYVVRVVLATWVELQGAFLAWKRMRRCRGQGAVVLDRYYPDVLLRCAWRLGVVPRLGWTLWNLLPRPDLVVALTIDHDLGRIRKKDQSLTSEEYERKAALAAAINDQAYAGTLVYRIDVTDLRTDAVHSRIRSYVEGSELDARRRDGVNVLD